ncbi:hypothetical protein GV64_14675 [Endozoicomonas elysicola]|uniref:Uncharacterized protein n=2 Tax=Endozoicomonas elysicola TaxID=305900 RepID=A0A081KCE0_9GAMM|nr:hypothetical protein GV64_14675 [Endozoicomonas elysicola]
MGRTPLILAAQKGHVDTVALLVAHDSNINAADDFRRTALHEAVCSRFPRVVDHLIQCKVMINAYDYHGSTGLIYAAELGELSSVRMLLQAHAKVDHVNKYGRTALIQAAANGHYMVVEILVQSNADIHHNDLSGNNANYYAYNYGHIECCKYLIKNGAKLDELAKSMGLSEEVVRNKIYASRPENLEEVYF